MRKKGEADGARVSWDGLMPIQFWTRQPDHLRPWVDWEVWGWDCLVGGIGEMTLGITFWETWRRVIGMSRRLKCMALGQR